MMVLVRIFAFLYTFVDADTIKGINEEREKREKRGRDRKVMERACRAKTKKIETEKRSAICLQKQEYMCW